MSLRFDSPADVMRRALELAGQGRGLVEPNPMVGAVIVDDGLDLLGEGWHQRFGGPHAEVHAIAAAGERCRGATLFCTLEPCAHHGKTPPCADAVIAAGLRKVVIALRDPAPHVDGRGIERLRTAGIEVEVGLLEDQARRLTAPFITLMTQGRPYVHAKWAMTLDGKIASRTGHSQWISNEQSRARVHELRGRMDGILIGSGTALADDPLLTARPAGPRVAVRIVLDSRGRLPIDCRLMQTTGEAPVLIVTTEASPAEWRQQLASRGVEVLVQPSDAQTTSTQGAADSAPSASRAASAPGPIAATDTVRRLTPAGSPDDRYNVAGHSHFSLPWLLQELGRRRMMNLLVEGGGDVLGSFFDADLVDECHVFIAPKIVGGHDAPGPVGGVGLPQIPDAFGVAECTELDGDLYWRLSRPPGS